MTAASRGVRPGFAGAAGNLCVGLRVFAAATAAICAQLAASPAAAEPRARVLGELDGDLREAIQNAIGETDRPVNNRFEARRRARDAAEDAIAVLRSEGYYAYEVEADVEDAEPPQPIVRIETGPRFTISDPQVSWVGDPPAPPVQAAGEAVMGLAVGQPGRAADVVAAEGRIVAAVQKRGYADASAAERRVVADYADDTLSPEFRIAAGPLVRLDGVDLVTEGRTNPDWVTRLAPWSEGEPYDPEDVAELERRLLDTGVYDSVTVALGPSEDTTPEGLRPVVVSLAERDRRTLELGASYSSSEGVGVDARWTRYNFLRRADTLVLFGRASELDSRLGSELTLPHWRRPQQTLTVGAEAFRLETDAYQETGARLRADVQRRFGKTSYVTVGGSLEHSRTEESTSRPPSPLGESVTAAAALAAISLDRSNDPLNPTTGWRLEGRAEPTILVGENETLPYLRAQAGVSAYYPVDDAARTVLAGRVRVGSAIGAELPDLPSARRFYAGGGGSVRGYAFQAVGPRFPDNSPQGGLSLFEASFEVRQAVGEKWGVVAFVDAGSVGGDEVPDFGDVALGAGLGVRYDLGFAPVRADIAVPLDKRPGDADFHIYLSIGQAF